MKALPGNTPEYLNRHTRRARVVAALAREAGMAVTIPLALGLALLYRAKAGRWMLDRRGLTAWERAWAEVGPQWTKRFKSRG